MRRIELIPQTKAAINQGKVFYHFSAMRRAAPRAPSPAREHQICFFESHFAEMKYGWISGEAGAENPNLQFMVGQQSRWKTEWLPGVWHNIAFEIVSRPIFFPPVPLAFFLFLSLRRTVAKEREFYLLIGVGKIGLSCLKIQRCKKIS